MSPIRLVPSPNGRRAGWPSAADDLVAQQPAREHFAGGDWAFEHGLAGAGNPAGSGGAARESRSCGAGRPASAGSFGAPRTAALLQLGKREAVGHLTEHPGQWDAERRADRGEQLRGCLFLAPLYLRQIAERHPCGGRNLAESATLP